MTGIKNFIETECNGELEGYREGGDDFIARFPSKDLAIRAGLDSAWFALNNGAKIRAGVGRSRREAGQVEYNAFFFCMMNFFNSCRKFFF